MDAVTSKSKSESGKKTACSFYTVTDSSNERHTHIMSQPWKTLETKTHEMLSFEHIFQRIKSKTQQKPTQPNTTSNCPTQLTNCLLLRGPHRYQAEQVPLEQRRAQRAAPSAGAPLPEAKRGSETGGLGWSGFAFWMIFCPFWPY